MKVLMVISLYMKMKETITIMKKENMLPPTWCGTIKPAH